MATTIKKFITTCRQCQVMKGYRPKTPGLVQPLDVPSGRWRDLSIDFVTGLPKTDSNSDMIMVVVDRFSKRAHFVTTSKTIDSQGVLSLLFRYIFGYHGLPSTIVSDRDIRFTSSAYAELTKQLGIKLLLSSSNHPETDGQTESVNKTLGRLLRTYCSQDHNIWDNFLPLLEFVHNSTYQAGIGSTPFEVDIGYIPNEPLLDTDNVLSARNFSQVQLTKHLKAITLRTKEFLSQRKEVMEQSRKQTDTDSV